VSKKGRRVLVIGDSQTQGVVNARETFSSVLEALLNEGRGRAVEVLNAGVGFTGPTCYLGTLRKRLELRPDLVLVVLFTGNDLADELVLDDLRLGREPPPTAVGYAARLALAVTLDAGFVYQGGNQAFHFKSFPERTAEAVRAATVALDAIRTTCAEHGISLVMALLPTKTDVDPWPASVSKALAALGLTEEEYAENLQAGRQILGALEGRGVTCVDLTAALQARRGAVPLYWNRDHHLSVRGHRVVAEVLARLPAFEKLRD
jgi:hypothetical protein